MESREWCNLNRSYSAPDVTFGVKLNRKGDRSGCGSVKDLSQLRYDTPMDVEVDEFIEKPRINELLGKCDLRSRGPTRILSVKKSDVAKRTERAPLKMMLILCTLLGIIFLVPYYDRITYNRTLDVIRLREELSRQVLDQDGAITAIIDTVNNVNSEPKLHLLGLIGRTGVGKTHCTNIIKRRFKPNQIFELSMDSLCIEQSLLHRYVPYLIVIDNYAPERIDELETFIATLPANRSILILVMFNVQTMSTDGEHEINEELYADIPKKLNSLPGARAVRFNKIRREKVKQLFDRVKKTNPAINYNQIAAIIEEHDFDGVGFKGFFAKLNLINNPNLLFR